MIGRITKSDGVATAIWPFERLAKLPAAIITMDFNPMEFKNSVARSIGFRKKALAQFEAAELKTADPKARAKIRHYRKGLEEAITALQGKARRVDEMISPGIIPYGSTI